MDKALKLFVSTQPQQLFIAAIGWFRSRKLTKIISNNSFDFERVLRRKPSDQLFGKVVRRATREGDSTWLDILDSGVDPGNSDRCRGRLLRGHQLRGRKNRIHLTALARVASETEHTGFLRYPFCPVTTSTEPDNVVGSPFARHVREVLAPTNPQFAVWTTEASAGDGCPCSVSNVGIALEITTTYGPQMFVAWLRIPSAR